MRIRALPREKAAVIKLRRLGYSFSQIAGFLGRSTSFVNRAIQSAYRLRSLSRYDLRKLQADLRKRSARIRLFSIEKYRHAWESWIIGEGEKPP